MKVSELIEKLKELPQDLEVVCPYDDEDRVILLDDPMVIAVEVAPHCMGIYRWVEETSPNKFDVVLLISPILYA